MFDFVALTLPPGFSQFSLTLLRMSVTNEAEDILNDALEFLGGQPVIDNTIVKYGDLTLSTARKVTKFVFLIVQRYRVMSFRFSGRQSASLMY